jgi:transglutaminase-like putative cysteine protease
MRTGNYVLAWAALPLLLTGSPGARAQTFPGGSKPLNGPGVIRAMAQAPVRVEKPGTTGMVTFPIPGTYREQVPLSFTVQTQPPSALRSFRWVLRPDGINWLCEVTVAPPAKGAIVKWESYVLVGARKDGPMSIGLKPEVPPEAAAWTHSTACVQSDDPAIRAKAEELAKGAHGIASYVKRVIAFTSTNQGKGAPFDRLDARRALDNGGSCTSRANLAAALLRAHGIPARTLSHLPAWAPKLYEHWLVEYWHPDMGWVWAESTLNIFRPQPWTLVVLNVANPEDENKAFDPIHLRYIMPGAAYLSGCELSKELFPADLFPDDATNQAVSIAPITGSDAELADLFAAAKTAHAAMAKAATAGQLHAAPDAKLLAAIRSGKATAITTLLQPPVARQ